jgi:jumonji domain-containing protein 2
MFNVLVDRGAVLRHGICKIVPPAGWKPREAPYEDKDSMVLNGPVRQEAMGHSGTYQCVNVTQKPMTIGEFKKLALKEENCPPLSEQELCLTPERRAKTDFWELEKKYWQGFAGKPPVYGADNFSETLFEDCAGAW